MKQANKNSGGPSFRSLIAKGWGIVCGSKRPLSFALALLLASVGARAQDAWLFAYFKEPGNQGIYLALSRDGYHYTALNDGQPWLAPTDPRPNPKEGEDIRDIFLTRAPDNTFRAVWTWNWTGNSLGTASSPDLIHWSEQKQIPIMQDFPNVNNVWAPETYWDEASHKWLLIWSSSTKDSKDGNRIWSSLTSDFNTFTKPTIFFDPGYVVIDATIFQAPNQPYRLIFKEQSTDPLTYQERVATSGKLTGPYDLKTISGFINEPWSEGPSAIAVGDRVVVFYDHYRAPHAQFEAVATRDWKHWEDITSEISLPAYCKHGSFLRITEAEATRLEQRHDPPYK
jgi:Glycosyl hydrolases family 43